MRTEKEIKAEIKRVQALLKKCKEEKSKNIAIGMLHALGWCLYYMDSVEERSYLK